MTISDVLLFLAGDADAIRRVLTAPDAIIVAALFVASAALARNHDTRSILHRPLVLAMPFVASLGLAVLLFALIELRLTLSGAPGPPLVAGFRSFLAAYWMTAPLAWLYGLPFERILNPLSAIRARLATLGVVATWRVLLMGRVLTLLLDGAAVQAYALVIGFGAIVVIGAAIKFNWNSPYKRSAPHVIFTMAGIRRPTLDAVALQRRVVGYSAVVALLGAPFFVIASLSVPCSALTWSSLREAHPGVAIGAGSADWMALAAITFWSLCALFNQPRHYRAAEVDRLLRVGRIDEAFDRMTNKPREAFPPNWVPEPREHFHEPPTLVAIAVVLHQRSDRPTWAGEHFAREFRAYAADAMWYYHDADVFERFVRAVESAPNRRELASVALSALAAHERELRPLIEGIELAKERHKSTPGTAEPRPAPPPLVAEFDRDPFISRLRAISGETEVR